MGLFDNSGSTIIYIMVDIWREDVCIRFGSVDRSNRLTLGSIFSFFQEAAISHAADLGVGVEDFRCSGQVWILSRLSLFVERRPMYGETIEVSTWPRRWEKLFAIRDYEIRDAQGIAVIRGRAGWLVLDIEKRKPLRIEPVLGFLPPNDGIDAFRQSSVNPSAPSALSQRENLVKVAERIANYSDIDYYGHANNARYVQWIQDVTDMDLLANADEFRLDINYLSEVLPRETVELWTVSLGEAAPGFAYEGRRPGTGQVVFRAELRAGCGDQG